MKRVVSVLMALAMLVTSVGGFAEEVETLTFGNLLGQLMESVAGVFETGEFALGFTKDEMSLEAGLYKDAQGAPVVEASAVQGEETIGARVSSEGVILSLPEGAQGLKWESVGEMIAGELGFELSDIRLPLEEIETFADAAKAAAMAAGGLALKEMNIDGLLDITAEDGQVLKAFFEDIAAGVGEDAVLVVATDAAYGGMPARKTRVVIDVDALIGDLSNGVSRALMQNEKALDGMFARLSKLVGQLIPETNGQLTTADLLGIWTQLGLSQLSTGGLRIDVSLTATGSIADPWKVTLSAANISFEAWLGADGLQFILDPGTGEMLAFDSRDAAYLLNLLAGVGKYVTRDAFEYVNETSGGMRSIRFSMDGVRLQRQLMTGLIRAIAAERDGIDALLAKYRPWFNLFAPEMAEFTADTFVMALTVMNADMRSTGIVSMLGFDDVMSEYMQFELSYPVEEEPAMAFVDDGLAAAPSVVEKKTGPVKFIFDNGFVAAEFSLEENDMHVYLQGGTGLVLELTAAWDEDGLTATASQSYIYRPDRVEAITLEANADGMRIYTADGENDVRLAYTDTGADITGLIGGYEVSGNIVSTDGLWKLTLSDGNDTVEVEIHYTENSFELTTNIAGEPITAEGKWGGDGFDLKVNAAGQILTASGKWGEDGYALNFSAGTVDISINHEKTAGGSETAWNISTYEFFCSGSLCAENEGFTFSVTGNADRRNSPNYIVLTADASWAEADPHLNLSLEGAGNAELSIVPGQLMFISSGMMVILEDATPVGSADKNIIRLTVYDAAAFYNDGAGLNGSYTRYEVVTTVQGAKYDIAVLAKGEQLCGLTLDFDPEEAAPAPADVVWMPPEQLKLMLGLVAPETASSEMPIPVYAEDAPVADEADRMEFFESDAEVSDEEEFTPPNFYAGEPEDDPADQIEITIDGEPAGSGLCIVSAGTVRFGWYCEFAESYYVTVTDGSGNAMLSGEAIPNTAFQVRTESMNPGEIYTLSVGAMPSGGSVSDIVWREVDFMLP